MRSQSSIEFLTTYSFLILILSIAVSVILFIATAPTLTIPSQCSSFTGPTCNLAQIYTNQSLSYSMTTLSFTNSQSVPVNIISISVTIKASPYTGYCTPTFLYPGEQTTCVAQTGGTLSVSSLIQGYYQLNAQYCNSGVLYLSRANCTYETIAYSGAFGSMPQRSRSAVFSVVAAQSPNALHFLSYAVIKPPANAPVLPNNFSILQDGDWVSMISSGTIGYAFATNTPMLGTKYFGYTTQSYPSSLYWLNSNSVACSLPYNSLISIASTTLYFSSPASSTLNIKTSGEMEVFYKGPLPGSTWQSAFLGGNWLNQIQTLASNTATISFSKGLYSIAVMWSNPCGGGGQVFKLSGIPS